MVSIDQVANGLMIYARDYLIGQIPKDNVKYVLGNVALEVLGMGVNKHKQDIEKYLVERLGNGPLAPFMENFVTPDGMVDIEMLKSIMPKYIQPEGFKLPIKYIGTFSIQPNDIDVIYNCIMNVPNTIRSIPGGDTR